jgi:hypothetical protein
LARPVKYTPKVLDDLKVKFDDYINHTQIPILKEFCYKNKLNSTYIHELPELTESIKRLRDKKEAQLERLGLKGKIDRTMAVFSLKQLGWKDAQNITAETITAKVTIV